MGNIYQHYQNDIHHTIPLFLLNVMSIHNHPVFSLPHDRKTKIPRIIEIIC